MCAAGQAPALSCVPARHAGRTHTPSLVLKFEFACLLLVGQCWHPRARSPHAPLPTPTPTPAHPHTRTPAHPHTRTPTPRRFGAAYGCSGRLHARAFNLMTKYFCGHDAVCNDVCSPAALAKARQVLADEYQLVGLVDQLDDTLRLLERAGPAWFGGLHTSYTIMKARGHEKMRQGKAPSTPLQPRTERILRLWNAQDHALFQDVKAKFERARACLA